MPSIGTAITVISQRKVADFVLVVSALREEMKPLIRKLRRPERRRAGPTRLYRSRQVGTGPELRLLVTGDGAGRAKNGIAAFFDLVSAVGSDHCSAVIVIGVSGGVTPDLTVGELIVGNRVALDRSEAEAAMEMSYQSRQSTPWMQNQVAGLVVTVSHLADTVSAKAALRRRWEGIGGGPIAVDLESYWYVAAAESRGIPWTVIRAVSDTSMESLPRYLDSCRDEDGATNRFKVLWRALINPASWPALIRLGCRTASSAARLERAVMGLVVERMS